MLDIHLMLHQAKTMNSQSSQSLRVNPTYKTGLKDRLLEKSIKKDTKMNGKKNSKKPIIV